jgi:quercetin dioxygenase-like cupin family protein
MKLKKLKNISSEDITDYGSTGTTIQWIWSRDDHVPNFFLRRFIITPGNQIGLHNHAEEHEIFILNGEGLVFNDAGEEYHIEPEDTLYVPPNEPHGYKNTGQTDLIFLCIIPHLKKD